MAAHMDALSKEHLTLGQKILDVFDSETKDRTEWLTKWSTEMEKMRTEVSTERSNFFNEMEKRRTDASNERTNFYTKFLEAFGESSNDRTAMTSKLFEAVTTLNGKSKELVPPQNSTARGKEEPATGRGRGRNSVKR
jgi:exonuclease V gamma subunit